MTLHRSFDRRTSRPAAVALVVLLVVACASRGAASESLLAGAWHGQMAQSLRLVLHFEPRADGGLTGTLDSPDQGALGIPLGSIETRNESLFVAVPSIGADYVARRVSADSLEGEWRQGGVRLPLALGRRAMEAPRRAQEPRGALPYDARNAFIDAADGVRLAGTLTVPRGRGPHPAVLLISGSGPQNRDEEAFGHRPFLVIADHLTRRGIAVLRVDDRGVAASTGSFGEATSEDFARDARACVDWLRRQEAVDPRRVGLVGHSEGALIAPLVAGRDPGVACVVLLAGPATDGETVSLDQLARMRLAAGQDGASIERLVEQHRRVFAEIKRADTTGGAARLRPLVRGLIESLSARERAQIGDVDAMVESQVRQLSGPWFRFFLRHDPRPALEGLRCPTLALYGEKDLQVAPAVHRAPMERALRASVSRDAEVRVLPGLNHLFQHATTGLPSEYVTLEETFDPAALDQLSGWIGARLGAVAQGGDR
jgi:pimeloyl-ACP methyl ester carboxylesterase